MERPFFCTRCLFGPLSLIFWADQVLETTLLSQASKLASVPYSCIQLIFLISCSNFMLSSATFKGNGHDASGPALPRLGQSCKKVLETRQQQDCPLLVCPKLKKNNKNLFSFLLDNFKSIGFYLSLPNASYKKIWCSAELCAFQRLVAGLRAVNNRVNLPSVSVSTFN